jgi:thioredoxin 1
MAGQAIDLTNDNFEETINNNEIVFIDFWADWCGPCKMFGPIFEKAAGKHTDVTFAKVDTEAQQELAAQFGIRSIPTLGVFRSNVLLYLQPGMVPAEGLDDLVNQVKALDMAEVKKEIAEQEAKHAHDHDHGHGHKCNC